jgi:WD40 repeat protein
VRSVAVSPDGSKIVSGSDDNTVRVRWRCFGCILGQNASWFVHDPQVWDFASGEVLRSWEAHPGTNKNGFSGVLTVAISGDGSKIVSGGYDGLVK